MDLPARKPHVLVVEDDPDMRRLVAWILRKDGYLVEQANAGAELLSRAQRITRAGASDAFDVIVSDVMMPDLTAFEVIDALRFRNLATPIILLTAYGAASLRPDASALGVHAILDKPVDWAVLRTVVRDALSEASQQLDLGADPELPEDGLQVIADGV